MYLYLRVIALLMLCAVTNHLSAQSFTYASQVTANLDGGSITGTNNAAIVDNSFAEISVPDPGLGSKSASLIFTFSNNPASSASPLTVYIRTSAPSKVQLSSLLSVNAYNGNSSPVTLLNGGLKTYYTPDGSTWLAITPGGPFQTVKLTLASVLLGGTQTLKVYYAFYSAQSYNASNPYAFNAADCGSPVMTTKDFSDIILTNFDVWEPGAAIDENLDTKSRFATDGVSLLNSGRVRQTFFFKGGANSGDAVRFIISQGGSILSAKLASSITVRGYNGSNSVGTIVPVSDLLDVELLDILGGTSPITFFFAPKDGSGNPVIFDRVELEMNIGTLGVSLGSNGLNIHDVRRVPAQAVVSDASVCANVGLLQLSALSAQAGINGVGSFSFAWYNQLRGGNLLNSGQSWTATGLTSPGQATYYVETKKSGSDTGCVASARKKVTVNILPAPAAPGLGFNN